MEPWRPSGHTHESDYSKQRRILGNTSGNNQPQLTDLRKSSIIDQEDLDSQKAELSSVLSNQENKPSRSENHESKYPLPSKVVKSNDQFTLNEQYLAAQRARRLPAQTRLLADRPYLRDGKYIEYRNRRRQDSGKDGKPIWPDYLEESFQNAIVQIPPMGRRKKPQYGKLHGRNELVSEWIFQETNERRSRKQVSSHIQVLGNKLKHVPEWRSLTKSDSGIDEEETGCEFWFESIADMVKAHRQLSAQGNSSALYNHALWLGKSHQRHNLQRLNFDMWVALPESVTHALHSYTRIQSFHSVTPVISLENVKNWRTSFPNLEMIIAGWTEQECDIIMLKSSQKLMSDFPPPTSKLGLVLELDFRHPTQERLQNLAGLRSWSCVNRMYENGKLFRNTEHKECKLKDVGCVKPFFEAEWWASQFTKLTDRRKQLVMPEQVDAEAMADNHSRGFLKGLTIMQEIFAAQEPNGRRQRICILLWSFTQAHKGSSGTTSWQKLVPPSNQNTVDVLPPGFDAYALPPLDMDSTLEDDLDVDMIVDDFTYNPIHVTGDGVEVIEGSHTSSEGSDCHTGFTSRPGRGLRPSEYSFSHTAGLTPRVLVSEAQPGMNEELSFLQSDQVLYEHASSLNASFDSAQSVDIASIFDDISLPIRTLHDTQTHIYEQSESFADQRHSSFATEVPKQEHSPQRRPLATFNVDTHMMLQAQLGELDSDTNHPQSFMQDISNTQETLHSATAKSQTSLTGHLDDMNLSFADNQMSAILSHNPSFGMSSVHDYIARSDLPAHLAVSEADVTQQTYYAPLIASPKVARPPLMAHHSFTGLPSSSHFRQPQTHPSFMQYRTKSPLLAENLDYVHENLDTPGRNEFANLIAHLDSSGGGSGIDEDMQLQHYEMDLAISTQSPALLVNQDQDQNQNTSLDLPRSTPLKRKLDLLPPPLPKPKWAENSNDRHRHLVDDGELPIEHTEHMAAAGSFGPVDHEEGFKAVANHDSNMIVDLPVLHGDDGAGNDEWLEVEIEIE